jgi:isocitrate dehydrogenase
MEFSAYLTYNQLNKMLFATQKRSFASFKKVSVSKHVVDIDGDEMTKVIWAWIKEKVSLTQA